jgi:hypothetical protein
MRIAPFRSVDFTLSSSSGLPEKTKAMSPAHDICSKNSMR